MRPQASISDKKIVDTKLMRVMNHQIEVESVLNEKLSENFKCSLTRQISPSKKVRKAQTP
jgi:hypothetical protein